MAAQHRKGSDGLAERTVIHNANLCYGGAVTG